MKGYLLVPVKSTLISAVGAEKTVRFKTALIVHSESEANEGMRASNRGAEWTILC